MKSYRRLIALLTLWSLVFWGAVTIGLYSAFRAERNRRPARAAFPQALNPGPGPNGPARVEEAPAQEPRVLLERLQAACRAGDRLGVGRCLDTDRMYEEFLEAAALPRPAAGERPARLQSFRVGLTLSLAVALDRQGRARFEVKAQKPRRGPEDVVVYTGHWDARGNASQLCWWCRRGADGWKVYDFENIDDGLPFSGVMALNVQVTNQGPLPPWVQATDFYFQTQEALRAGQYDRAAKALQEVAPVHFPARIDACRWFLTGVVHLHQGKEEEALADFDRADRFNQEMPFLDLLRGIVYNLLGRHEEARAHVRKFSALFGEDHQTYFQTGVAMEGLGRTDEAVAAFRKSLVEKADSPGSLRELSKVLPAGRKAELAGYFVKLAEPEKHFYNLAAQALQRSDRETVEVLATAMRKLNPDEPDASYFLARLKGDAGRLEEALPLYRTALAKQADAKIRTEYVNELLQDALLARKPVLGYQAAPDPEAAFAFLARQLTPAHRVGELRQLVAAHEKARPADPLLPLYRGEVLIAERHFDQADKALAAGMAGKLDGEQRKQFLARRVYARFAAGKALSAYAELRPRREVFNELAGLLAGASDAATLRELFADHRRQDPRDTALPFWEAEVRWLVRDYPGTLRLLTEHRDVLLADRARQGKVRERLVLCLAHFGRLDEARQGAGPLLRGPNGQPIPLKQFQDLIRAAQNDGNDQGVLVLAEAMHQASPRDPDILIELARSHSRAGQFARAVPLYQQAFTRQPDGQKRKDLVSGMLLEAVYAGQALAGYRAAPDPTAAFPILARDLLDQGQREELARLLKVHEKEKPGDPQLAYYRGELSIDAGDFVGAERAFEAEDVKKLEGPLRRSYLSRRVYAAFKAGKGLPVFAELGPSREVFDQLAWLYKGAKDAKHLEELVAAYRRKAPADPSPALWEAEARRLSGDHAGAVQVLTEQRGKILAERGLQYRFTDLLLDSLIQLKRLDEARKEAAAQVKETKGVPYNVLDTLNRLLAKKQIEGAEALAETLSTAGPNFPEGPYQLARIRLVQGRAEEAARLYKEALGRAGVEQQEGLTSRFLLEAARAGKALEGYRAVPDARKAFRTLAGELLRLHRLDELRHLVEVHRDREPEDPWRHFCEGELLLEKGRPDQAEKEFAAAGKGPLDQPAQDQVRGRRLFARVRASQAVAAYAEVGPGSLPFTQLAWDCDSAKDGKQLEALVAAHRRHDPDDRTLPAWDAEARWLKGDYAETVDLLRKQERRAFLRDGKLRDRLVRSLVRLRRFDEARQEAVAAPGRGGGRVLLALVHASAGDVARTTEVVQACAGQPYLLRSLYRDPDLGPLLRGERFRSLRERFPEPQEDERLWDLDDLDD
jgi:tetratricopeptide (TPR) repeat protein